MLSRNGKENPRNYRLHGQIISLIRNTCQPTCQFITKVFNITIREREVKAGHGGSHIYNSRIWEAEAEDWEFRAFLGYKVSSRLGCAIGDPVTNKEE